MHRFAVAALVVASAALGLAVLDGAGAKETKEAKESKTVTLTGTLVDSKCFSMDPANKPNDHNTPKGKMSACAAACAKMGLPVGLLTDKGELYVLVAPAGNLADHMAKTARAKGEIVFGRSFRPDKLEVQGPDGKWNEVSLATMM